MQSTKTLGAIVLTAAMLLLASCHQNEWHDPYSPTPGPGYARCVCGVAWSGDLERCSTCGRESPCRCPNCHRTWPPGYGAAGTCPFCRAVIDVAPAR